MSVRKLGLAVSSALVVTAFAAPAPTPAQGIDVGQICASIIGNHSGTIGLQPLVRIGYQTCQNADLDGP
jgi:hypothetical protein